MILKQKNKFFVFLVLLVLVLIFYGRMLYTWFQQDEWDWIGRYIYYNSISEIPLWEAFKSSLFPHPRYRFTPFFDAAFTAEVSLFGLNFAGYALVSLILHAANSFLVFLIANRVAKNQAIAVVTAVLFATSGIGQKAVTWVFTSTNTQGAAFFSFLTILFFLDYLKKRQKSGMIKVFISFLAALWFKETAVALFFLLPTLALIKSGRAQFKRSLVAVVIFALTYFIGRGVASAIGARIHTEGYPDFGRFLTPLEYLEILIWTPLRSVVNVFVNPNTLNQLAHIVTPFFWPHFRGLENTTAFGLFSESTGVDLTTLLLLVPVCLLLYVVYRMLPKGKTWQQVFFIAIALIFTSTVISPLQVIRGESAFVHIIRSRDIYMAVAGSSMIFSLLCLHFWQKGGFQKKILVVFFIAMYFWYNWGYINKAVLDEEIKRAQTRKPIIEQIYYTHPALPKKVLFYTESDTPYYGSSTPGLPFQTGFGRTLLVWYAMNGHEDLKEFTKADFLYYPHEQGYKENGEYGFGYFTELEKIQETIITYNLSSDSIYAFSYYGAINSLIDTTQKIRRKLSQE